MPVPENCGADLRSQEIFDLLKENYTLPNVDLADPAYSLPTFDGDLGDRPVPIDDTDLTQGTLTGTGTFDIVMQSLKAHLKQEYQESRITGDQYAKAYIELVGVALGSSVQFLLGREQSKWQSLLMQAQVKKAEIEAVTASVGLQISKAQMVIAIYETQKSTAEVALTKMKLSSEDAQFCLTKAQEEQLKYQTANILTVQATNLAKEGLGLDAKTSNTIAQTGQITSQTDRIIAETAQIVAQTGQVSSQTDQIIAQTEQLDYQTLNMLPAQKDLLIKQVEQITAQVTMSEFQISDILPAQKRLVEEQAEVQRAQTMDTRFDNITPIAGSTKKQQDLYDQQIDSYIKDAQYKAGKMYLDAWITQKTLDEGLVAPTELTNATIGSVLESVRLNNNLG